MNTMSNPTEITIRNNDGHYRALVMGPYDDPGVDAPYILVDVFSIMDGATTTTKIFLGTEYLEVRTDENPVITATHHLLENF